MKGHFRFPVGSFACTSLLDGSNEYAPRDFFANAPEAEVRAVLKSRSMPVGTVTTPYSYLHVDTGDHQVLVDVGAGSVFPTTGALLRNMRDADIEPTEVDTVIITHAHPDHIGGMLLEDRSLAFPNATYVICKREWDYWFSDEARAREHRFPRFFDLARSSLAPARERLRLVEFTDGKEVVFPGVHVWRAHGHTPGHMVVEFASNGESLFYIGDIVLSPIHLEHPDWVPVYDAEPENAAVSKRYVFDLVAARSCWVLGQHFPPFPSLGRVARRGEGWEWRPIEAAEEGRGKAQGP